ncbi:unnamed protein product, partial [Mesorhabditis belari]|uniref:Uncharacterized protein n=1 Tax=Mesorhabditis belari TaxID=2138241 RepID=A0AAF3FRU7_9BILA
MNTPIRPIPQNLSELSGMNNPFLQSPISLGAQTVSLLQSPLTLFTPFALPGTPTSTRSTPLMDKTQASSAFSPYHLPLTPKRTKDLNRYRKEFCYICNDVISIEGKRSQGPRRHIVQKHLKAMLFRCPHPNCGHGSVYDRHHVTSHMKRMHGDHSEKVIVGSEEAETEIQAWYEKCFARPESFSENRMNLENFNPLTFPTPTPSLPLASLQLSLAMSPFRPLQSLPINNPYVTPELTPTRKLNGFMIGDILGQ